MEMGLKQGTLSGLETMYWFLYIPGGHHFVNQPFSYSFFQQTIPAGALWSCPVKRREDTGRPPPLSKFSHEQGCEMELVKGLPKTGSAF